MTEENCESPINHVIDKIPPQEWKRIVKTFCCSFFFLTMMIAIAASSLLYFGVIDILQEYLRAKLGLKK